MKTASIDWHGFLKQLTNLYWRYLCLIQFKCVSTLACSNQRQLAPCMPYLWFIVSSIKFIFRVVGGHIISVIANRLSNKYQFRPYRFPANCQYFQPNSSISKHWPILEHGFVKWCDNKWNGGGYRRDGDQDSARLSRLNLTTFFMPSIKIRFSFTDNQWYSIQSCALAHWSIWVVFTPLTHWQLLSMKSLCTFLSIE